MLYLRRSSIPALFLATVAQYGMTPGDLAEAVDIAFNGEVTQVLEQALPSFGEIPSQESSHMRKRPPSWRP
jgi:hypothetical protein